MHSRLPSPTKAEKKRFLDMYEIGCVCSYIMGYPSIPATIHHILNESGSKRLGHSHTIPLSTWHHFGELPEGFTKDEIEDALGPSMKLNKKNFVKHFGSELELLVYTNQLLAQRKKIWEI